MKRVGAMLQLIRWPNLVFIIITQLVFYFAVFQSLLWKNNDHFVSDRAGLFLLLILASVLIAAAGYIINDYFDLHIDKLNKPERVIVDKKLNRRWAILLHLLFSVAGISISLYVSYKTKSYIIGFANTGCVILLWFYSTWFKKTLLLGNVIISFLTGWVTAVVYFFAGAKIIYRDGWMNAPYPFDVRKLFVYTMMYAGFSFILSLVREAIKDVEDMQGDAKHGCRTLPIVAGIPATKIYLAVWMSVVIAAVTIISFYAVQTGWWISASFALVFILAPSLYILKGLKYAVKPADFGQLSSIVKLIMLAGILSMLFFISPYK